MIGISKLYCNITEPSDPLRYGRDSKRLPSYLLQFSVDKRPVVVWNITRACNLRCVHCYASAGTAQERDNELALEEVKRVIDDLADFGVPVILFSGGEPLLRPDLPQMVDYAAKKGIRTVISTNGTLLTEKMIRAFDRIDISYIGISLDGKEEVNDRFRGVEGAFYMALEGIRRAKRAGIKVGIRFTMNKRTSKEIPFIFDLIEKEGIERVCFYHLVYAGRGSLLMEEDLSHEETRGMVDYIMARTKELYLKGKKVEVLTVDNHADGPYLYLRLMKEDKKRAEKVLELLKMNGGNGSGVAIGCIDEGGNVHPDQFWRHLTLGNVRQRPFSEIWMDTENEQIAMLKDKKRFVKGRCAMCRWLDVCNGNLRVRAEAATGDVWAEDPQCYLTDDEMKG
jgi:12,18-didecarboxysiroheme deacetylase